jgi:diguanylate cyclase (GGDEF)-like protein
LKRWSIKWRAIALALAPPLLIALSLALYFTKAHLDQIERSLRERGQAIARQLAPAAEYAVFTRDRQALQELVETIKLEPDVGLVTISDPAGTLLAASGDAAQRRALADRSRGIWPGLVEQTALLHFSEPIRRSIAVPDDLAEEAASEVARGGKVQTYLGHVDVSMSKAASWKQQEQILLVSAIITLVGVLIAALWALRFAGNLTRAVKRAAGAVEQISQGDFTVRVPEKSGGEIAHLERRINTLAETFRNGQVSLQEQLDLTTAQLAYQMTHDTLTGLINRREFEVKLGEALASAREHGKVHALLFMDLDQFKVVNDTCGHPAGDELIRQIVHQLRQKIRERDTLARIGGDEFTLLLENCHLDDAMQVAQQLREAAQNFRFVWEDKYFAIGASIGMVMITHAAESVTSLLSRADAACYTAKDLGRNRIHVFSEDDATRLARLGAMEWVTRITHAIQENRFALYCQSILPLKSAKEGDPEYYEILLRMRGANGEIILPMTFIPAAERFNQMQAIDRWVLRESFAMLRRLLDVPGKSRNAVFSINLSGSSLCEDSFAGFLQEQLVQFDIPPRQICFEVTETTAIANLTHAVKLMQYFKRLGCRFVLDDFGAGLSSFNYLKHLPVDGIKIDGSFVKGMAVNRMDATMVEAINDIGHAMGLTTAAEFVEDDATMRKLLEIGVDYAQGNWVHRPRPVQEWFAQDVRVEHGADRTLRLVSVNVAKR